MSIHSLILPSLNKVVKIGNTYQIRSDLPVYRETKTAKVDEIYAPTSARPQGWLKCNGMNEKGKMPTWQEFSPAAIGAKFIPNIVFGCNTCDNIVEINDTNCQACKDAEFKRQQELAAKLAEESNGLPND
jgi:hypothetical protein